MYKDSEFQSVNQHAFTGPFTRSLYTPYPTIVMSNTIIIIQYNSSNNTIVMYATTLTYYSNELVKVKPVLVLLVCSVPAHQELALSLARCKNISPDSQPPSPSLSLIYGSPWRYR